MKRQFGLNGSLQPSSLRHFCAALRSTVAMALITTALVPALVGTGCVSAGSNTTGSSENADAELVRALQQRTVWSANGALGLWTNPSANVSQQNITASVQWAEQSENLGVTLRGPLGIGEMKLQASAAGATLTRGNSTIMGNDPDTLVQQALGLEVPVPFSELSEWMRGLPGQAGSVSYDGTGRLQALSYADGTGVTWEAQIRRYTRVDGLQVPEIITATGGPYNIRLVLKKWRLDPVDSDATPLVNDPIGRIRIPRPAS